MGTPLSSTSHMTLVSCTDFWCRQKDRLLFYISSTVTQLIFFVLLEEFSIAAFSHTPRAVFLTEQLREVKEKDPKAFQTPQLDIQLEDTPVAVCLHGQCAHTSTHPHPPRSPIHDVPLKLVRAATAQPTLRPPSSLLKEHFLRLPAGPTLSSLRLSNSMDLIFRGINIFL